MKLFSQRNVFIIIIFALIAGIFLHSNRHTLAASYSATILADTPLVYWRLGDSSGTTATDSSGNSYDGTYNNVTLGSTSLLATDISNTAATFNGTDSYVLRSDVGNIFDLTTNFSVEAWINATSLPSVGDDAMIVAKNGAYSLFFDGNALTFSTRSGGTKFDSSHDRKQPFETKIGVGYVIKGWDMGIVGMKKGGKRKLTIPYHLAYGKYGVGDIPGFATLIFEIELLNIK